MFYWSYRACSQIVPENSTWSRGAFQDVSEIRSDLVDYCWKEVEDEHLYFMPKTSCAWLLGSKLKLSLHRKAHLLMLCKSLLIWFAVAFASVTAENNGISSASSFGFEVR